MRTVGRNLYYHNEIGPKDLDNFSTLDELRWPIAETDGIAFIQVTDKLEMMSLGPASVRIGTNEERYIGDFDIHTKVRAYITEEGQHALLSLCHGEVSLSIGFESISAKIGNTTSEVALSTDDFISLRIRREGDLLSFYYRTDATWILISEGSDILPHKVQANLITISEHAGFTAHWLYFGADTGPNTLSIFNALSFTYLIPVQAAFYQQDMYYTYDITVGQDLFFTYDATSFLVQNLPYTYTIFVGADLFYLYSIPIAGDLYYRYTLANDVNGDLYTQSELFYYWDADNFDDGIIDSTLWNTFSDTLNDFVEEIGGEIKLTTGSGGESVLQSRVFDKYVGDFDFFIDWRNASTIVTQTDWSFDIYLRNSAGGTFLRYQLTSTGSSLRHRVCITDPFYNCSSYVSAIDPTRVRINRYNDTFTIYCNDTLIHTRNNSFTDDVFVSIEASRSIGPSYTMELYLDDFLISAQDIIQVLQQSLFYTYQVNPFVDLVYSYNISLPVQQNLFYTYDFGFSTIFSGGTGPELFGIVRDSGGDMHALYRENFSSNVGYAYSTDNGGTWSASTVSTDNPSGDGYIFVDSSDTIHIFWRDSSLNLDYAYGSGKGASWTIENSISDNNVSSFAVDLDFDDNFYIYYQYSTTAMYEITGIGGGTSWSEVSVRNGNHSVHYVVVDSNGDPHVLYVWNINSELYYASRYLGGSFTQRSAITTTGDLVTSSPDFTPKIIIDTDNLAHFFYSRLTAQLWYSYGPYHAAPTASVFIHFNTRNYSPALVPGKDGGDLLYVLYRDTSPSPDELLVATVTPGTSIFTDSAPVASNLTDVLVRQTRYPFFNMQVSPGIDFVLEQSNVVLFGRVGTIVRGEEELFLLTPFGGETLTSGGSYNITWSDNITSSSADHVRLLLSTDYGATYSQTIVSSTTNDGSYTWTPLPGYGPGCRVKIILEDSVNTEIASFESGTFETTAPSADLFYTYNISTSADLFYTYNILVSVNQDLFYTYNILAGQDLFYTYNILAGQDLFYTYNIGTSADLFYTYNILAGQDLFYTYNIGTSADLFYTYNILVSVNQDLFYTYNILVSVNQDLFYTYNILAGQDLFYTYNILAGQDLFYIYNISTSADLFYTYNILVSVNQNLLYTYNILVSVNQDLLYTYNILASRDLFYIYTVSSTVTNNLYYVYTIGTPYNSLHFSYDILVVPAPSVADVTIAPSSPNTGDDLQLTYTYSDPSGLPEGGTLIRWFKNNAQQASLNNLTSVSNTYTSEDDAWFAVVSPGNGFVLGTSVESNSVTVIASAPVDPTSVTIYPASPQIYDRLFLVVIREQNTYDYIEIEWYKNSIAQASFANRYVVPSDQVTPGDVWTARARGVVGSLKSNWVWSD